MVTRSIQNWTTVWCFDDADNSFIPQQHFLAWKNVVYGKFPGLSPKINKHIIYSSSTVLRPIQLQAALSTGAECSSYPPCLEVRSMESWAHFGRYPQENMYWKAYRPHCLLKDTTKKKIALYFIEALISFYKIQRDCEVIRMYRFNMLCHSASDFKCGKWTLNMLEDKSERITFADPESDRIEKHWSMIL